MRDTHIFEDLSVCFNQIFAIIPFQAKMLNLVWLSLWVYTGGYTLFENRQKESQYISWKLEYYIEWVLRISLNLLRVRKVGFYCSLRSQYVKKGRQVLLMIYNHSDFSLFSGEFPLLLIKLNTWFFQGHHQWKNGKKMVSVDPCQL